MKRYGQCIVIIILMLIAMPVQAHPAWGIVVDDKGNIYFADILHNGLGSVWKFTTDGTLELVLGDFHAHNLSLDNQGMLVVANGENHQTMLRLLGNNRYDTLITTTDFTDFNGGNCAFTPQGEVVFGMGGYLWKLDDNGNKTLFSSYKFGWNQTVYPAPDGNFYAADIGDGRGKLIRIDRQGRANVIASDLMQFNGRSYDRSSDVLLGIGQHPSGDLFIAETAGKRIIRITAAGTKSTYYTPTGDWFPTGITFHEGSAYILEFNGNTARHGPRITKISHDGNAQVIFDYRNHKL